MRSSPATTCLAPATTAGLLLAAAVGSLVLLLAAVPVEAQLTLLSTPGATRPAEDVVLAVLHLAALGVAGWVALTATVTLVACLSGWTPLAWAAVRTAPPLLRGLVQRSLAGALVGTTLLGASPAVAAPPPPGLVPPDAGEERTSSEPARLPTGGTAPVPSDRTSEPREHRHTVVRGEHLWSIASDQITRVRGGVTPDGDGAPDEDEVADYWRQVVTRNRGQLRSGDPDLIHPGEEIVLPPIDDHGHR